MSLDSKVLTFSNSKVRKGKLEEAMKTLQKLRGSSYRGVEEEVVFSHHFSLTLHCFLPSSFHNDIRVTILLNLDIFICSQTFSDKMIRFKRLFWSLLQTEGKMAA